MNKSTSKKVGIIDTTLRDGQQCLWATRMTSSMMAPIARQIDEIGYDMIDFMAPVQFDVCVRYLQENPWEKARRFRELFQNTPLRGYCRSKSLAGFSLEPDDMVQLWIQRLHANGFKVVGTLDALFDVDNMLVSIREAKRLGMYSVGALVFCDSPVHTDEMYANTARRLVREGNIDAIMIKDSGALLTPDRIRTLVPALRQAIGNRKLELHGHCNTALAPLVYLEGVKLGVDQLHASIAPLASGPAQPSVQLTNRNLDVLGFHTGLDMTRVQEVSDYLYELADREGFPISPPQEYEAFHYKHQMPGGMIENWKYQLRQAGLIDRFDEILEEVAIVREELGWPIMVTPFSQILAVQAMLNVVSGTRYGTVPDEVKHYALGHFGKLLAPVKPDVLDRIVENGSKTIPIDLSPPEPALPAMRKAYPKLDDDDLILRYMFPGDEYDQMKQAGPLKLTAPSNSPVAELIKEFATRDNLRKVIVQKRDTRISYSRT
jgi:oxaloacetate decarboxylase (Na+ extruding) subunit alpha